MKIFSWIGGLFRRKPKPDEAAFSRLAVDLTKGKRGHVPPRPLPQRAGNIPPRRNPAPPHSSLAPVRSRSEDPVPAILMSDTSQGIPVQHAAPADSFTGGGGYSAGAGASSSYGDSSSSSSSSSGSSGGGSD